MKIRLITYPALSTTAHIAPAGNASQCSFEPVTSKQTINPFTTTTETPTPESTSEHPPSDSTEGSAVGISFSNDAVLILEASCVNCRGSEQITKDSN